MEKRSLQNRHYSTLGDVNDELRSVLLARKRLCAGIEDTTVDSLVQALAHLSETGESALPSRRSVVQPQRSSEFILHTETKRSQ